MEIKNRKNPITSSHIKQPVKDKIQNGQDTSEPQEKVDLSVLYNDRESFTREERISKALAKTGVRLARSTREFSMAFVGTAIGSAIGSSLGYGGPLIGGSVGSAVGAVGGLLWEGYDISGKIGNLFKITNTII